MNQSRPKISIGMPVYNGEGFIREALDSLLAQTFSDFELIISDNASTDATSSICSSYEAQDSRIRYVRQQENIGALANFQFVLNEAHGKYFMWAACDDKWDKDWVRLLCEKLDHVGNGAVFGKLLQIDEASQPVNHVATRNSFRFSGGYLRRRAAFFLEFEGKGKANLFYSLFRKESLSGADLLNTDTDYLILFDLLMGLEFISVNNVFLYKRIHTASCGTVVTKTKKEKLLEIIMMKTLWRDYCVAKSYLYRTIGFERLMLAILIPVKIFNSHLFYVWRVLNKLIPDRV